jgi:hypothetical protein
VVTKGLLGNADFAGFAAMYVGNFVSLFLLSTFDEKKDDAGGVSTWKDAFIVAEMATPEPANLLAAGKVLVDIRFGTIAPQSWPTLCAFPLLW